MLIQDVLKNLSKIFDKRELYKCPWENRFVRNDAISAWKMGEGKSIGEFVCPINNCEKCKVLQSNKFIRLTRKQRELNNV